jgi:hypothetical protein
MYTADDRDALRRQLVEVARSDDRITGAALTGSAVPGREDRWSDIDLAFGVRAGVDTASVVADWSARMYRGHDAVHHLDVVVGSWTYRVFLLRNGLQVDLAFAPASEFGARAPTFRLLFGEAAELPPAPKPSPAHLIGMAWLYCLHVRSCLARRKYWQAEYMLSTARDQVLALACLRHGLPTSEGRGMDALPAAVKQRLERAFAAGPQPASIARAFPVVIEALLDEAVEVDASLAERLAPVVRAFARAATESEGRDPAHRP